MGSEADHTSGVNAGPDAMRKAAVRSTFKYGADVIKFCASGGVLPLAVEVEKAATTIV